LGVESGAERGRAGAGEGRAFDFGVNVLDIAGVLLAGVGAGFARECKGGKLREIITEYYIRYGGFGTSE
jgi:hypothetical protein